MQDFSLHTLILVRQLIDIKQYMAIIIGNIDTELTPLNQALEALGKELEKQKKDSGQCRLEHKKQLSEINNQVDALRQNIVILEKRIIALEKAQKALEGSVISKPSSSSSTSETPDKPVHVKENSRITQGPVKRFFSSCGALGFEVSYLLSNPIAISGQGYYEVTDRGNDTGSYQPNVELGPTLLMNATSMLEPFFDVQHDGSGQLRVIMPGEVQRQGRVWQILKKGTIAY